MATGDITVGNRSSTIAVSLAGSLPLTWAASESKNLSFNDYKSVEDTILGSSYLYVVAPLGTTDPATENLAGNPVTYTPINFTAAGTAFEQVLAGLDVAIGTKTTATAVNLLAAGVTYTAISTPQTTLAGTLGALDVALKTAQTDLALQATAAEAVTAVNAEVLAAALPHLGDTLATLHLALEAIDADGLAALNAAIAAKTFSHAGMNAAVTLMEVLDAISAKLPA